MTLSDFFETTAMENPFRNLPSVNQILESGPIQSLIKTANRNVVVHGVRNTLDQVRQQIQSRTDIQVPTVNELATKIVDLIRRSEISRLRPVINATGVILHTGLGRAPLATEAIQAVADVAGGYASVELDLQTGERTQRTLIVERLLCELTGAEAAVVVNNNAAATFLSLAALASNRDVVVSRGQLVEIGGSYRLPDVMAASGARMVEVGTTNKTRLSDYEQAIGETTGAILKVHPSNYQVVGFTAAVPVGELVGLGRRYRVPVIDDIGSGALYDYTTFGLQGEPMPAESIEQGADVVLFSGDKLLGGPQCGIIVGRRDLVNRVLKHPLARAMRVDKMTLAALHATLHLYRNSPNVEDQIPCLQMLVTSLDNLRVRAEKLAPQIEALSGIASVDVITTRATVGGGSIPGQQVDSIGLAITPQTVSVDRLASAFRAGRPSVVGRIENEQLVFDLRTIFPQQDLKLVEVASSLDLGQTENAPDEKL